MKVESGLISSLQDDRNTIAVIKIKNWSRLSDVTYDNASEVLGPFAGDLL
jgi:hypothetical protein